MQNGGSRQKCDEAKIKAASKIPRIANAAKLQANPQTMPTGFLSKLPKPKKPMIITLQIVTIMGKKIPIKIKSSENVKALKKMVSEELGIKPSSQMLVYCNSELKDPQILTQLGIQDQSTIKLVLKMSGGILYI